MPREWVKSWTCSLNKPKIMSLPPEQFKAWQICLWIAGEHDQAGLLPPIEEIAFVMHAPVERIADLIGTLIEKSLIENTPAGFAMHDWQQWQDTEWYNTREAWRARKQRSRANARMSQGVTRDIVTGSDMSQVTLRELNRKELKKEIPTVSAKKPSLDAFVPSQADLDAALKAGVPQERIPFETEQWRDHHRSRGTKIKDYAASWRTWMRKAPEFMPQPRSNGRTPAPVNVSSSLPEPTRKTTKGVNLGTYAAAYAANRAHRNGDAAESVSRSSEADDAPVDVARRGRDGDD